MEHEDRVLFHSEDLDRVTSRMAHEILERSGAVEELALIGIQTRGAYLVGRIANKIEKICGAVLPVAVVDVTPYRDDIARGETATSALPPKVGVVVEEKTIVLVDDVIYTGRTIRAALDLLSQVGTPKRILVAILVDRGERELPIKADIVGKNVQVAESERVNVFLFESDGVDQVTVTKDQRRAVHRQRGPF